MRKLDVVNQHFNENCKTLTESLTNIFRSFVCQKIEKFDYRSIEWMNKSTRRSLKKQSILTKMYQNNYSSYNQHTLLNRARKYTALVTEAKERYIFNPIQDNRKGRGGRGVQKCTPTSFSSVTSTNIRINRQNFLTFSFNHFDTLL